MSRRPCKTTRRGPGSGTACSWRRDGPACHAPSAWPPPLQRGGWPDCCSAGRLPDTKGTAWGRDHTEAGWGGWYQTGGALLSGTGPSAAAAPDGIYVLVVGTNKQLYIQQVGVTGFTAAGGQTTSTPALVSTSDSLVGLVRGADNALWYHQFLPTTPGWHSLGGTLKTGTGGSASGDTPYAYGIGGNGQVWQHSGLAGGSWSQVTP